MYELVTNPNVWKFVGAALFVLALVWLMKDINNNHPPDGGFPA